MLSKFGFSFDLHSTYEMCQPTVLQQVTPFWVERHYCLDNNTLLSFCMVRTEQWRASLQFINFLILKKKKTQTQKPPDHFNIPNSWLGGSSTNTFCSLANWSLCLWGYPLFSATAFLNDHLSVSLPYSPYCVIFLDLMLCSKFPGVMEISSRSL